jgi:hypothetical protein
MLSNTGGIVGLVLEDEDLVVLVVVVEQCAGHVQAAVPVGGREAQLEGIDLFRVGLFAGRALEREIEGRPR